MPTYFLDFGIFGVIRMAQGAPIVIISIPEREAETSPSNPTSTTDPVLEVEPTTPRTPPDTDLLNKHLKQQHWKERKPSNVKN
jgi:hypothetical protein